MRVPQDTADLGVGHVPRDRFLLALSSLPLVAGFRIGGERPTNETVSQHHGTPGG